MCRFRTDFSQPIWLDDLNCTSRELHLLRCGQKRIGRHDCTHTEDVAVKCSELLFNAQSSALCLVLGRHGSVSLCRVERENKMAATYNVLAFKR